MAFSHGAVTALPASQSGIEQVPHGIDESLRDQVHFTPEKSRNAADQHGNEHIERGRCQTHQQ